jgi:hypothetical protein
VSAERRHEEEFEWESQSFQDPSTTHLPTLGRLTELRKNMPFKAITVSKT